MLSLVRKRVNTSSVRTEAHRPFRFFICGDPALVCDLRTLLLSGHGDPHIPLDAAATLESIDPVHRVTVTGPDARCVIFLARPGDVAGADFAPLMTLKLPIFAVTVDAAAAAAGPPTAPLAAQIGQYTVPTLTREALRTRVFPHIIDRCKGVEVAVGRRLPPMRESVAAKLTRDAASSALKIAAASAVVDHVPLLGFVLGAMASAGDMVAITGIQIVLMLQIGTTYGKDPDVQRIWELLPVVGSGLGWRALSRELAGFIPVAGIAIKGAIAYAGTIVVGEGVTFYYEQGRHMTAAQASGLYEEAKSFALSLVRDVVKRVRRK